MQEEKLKLNPLVFSVLVVYPILLIGLVTWYIMTYGFSWFEGLLFVTGYYGSNISVGLGLHRLWAHGAYKVNKFVEFILALFAAGTLQGPALVWASDHYKHHSFTDKEGDPHSPLKYKDRVQGFLWSHIGWMVYGNGPSKSIDRITMTKLGSNKILRWQMRYYWQIATFMNVALPMIVGYICTHNIQGAIAGFIFIGMARALQQQMTFCVNSLCHFVGSKTYYNGTAGDIWWMFMFLLGENWHNFHHAFANDYRNGVKWYHLDVHKWLIALLEKLGLATHLIRTPEVRIQARIDATRRECTENTKKSLSMIETTAILIAKAAQERLAQAEKSAEYIATKMRATIVDLQEKALILAQHSRDIIESSELLQKNIAQQYMKQLKKIQSVAKQVNISLPQLNLI
jgi:stearoyl-CoA desaturase (Delta-9 desaturase)